MKEPDSSGKVQQANSTFLNKAKKAEQRGIEMQRQNSYKKNVKPLTRESANSFSV